MLENWIQQPDDALTSECNAGTIGKYLADNQADYDSLETVKIAIISDNHTGNDHWRSAFYKLFNHFPGLNFVDLGSLRKNSKECLTPVVKELLAGGIFPIVVAQDESLSESIFVAYKTFGERLKLLIVDEKIRYTADDDKQTYVNKLATYDIRAYITPSVIGHQLHFIPPDVLSFADSFFAEQIRLGGLTGQVEESEPLIRDADIMMFNLGAIKSADAIAVPDPSPNGLTGHEACHLVRFAGFSDKLTAVGLFGYTSGNDVHHQTAALLAQLLWYTIDGFYHRLKEFPVSLNNLQAYEIEQKTTGYSLKFWKSKISGRWWLQMPGEEFNSENRNILIPCAQHDYELASRGEVPDRLFQALQKRT